VRPAKVVITIPITSWSKHDSVEGTCIVIRDMIKKLFDFRKLVGVSPFDTDNMTVEMPSREGPSKG